MATQEASSVRMKEEQQAIQRKTFMRWCNTYLVKKVVPMKDLIEDLKDGTMLINLLEIISGKSLGKYRYRADCKVAIHRLENITKALEFIRSEGIKLVNIESSDIEKGNVVCILGLLWTLILRYQIQKNKDESKKEGARNELLAWINARINPKVATNFSSDWKNGDYLCALLNAVSGQMTIKPTGDAMKDTEGAITLAEEKLGIPRVLDAVDLVNNPDELATMTYLSYYRSVWEKMQSKKADPSKAYAFGPGLTCPITNDRAPQYFTVCSFDSSGAPWPASDIKVVITDAQGKNVPVEIKPEGKDATYLIEYNPTVPGDHKINVMIEGKSIKDMPKTVKVRAGAAAAKSTSDVTVTIQAHRPNGEEKKEGGDRFEAHVYHGAKPKEAVEVKLVTKDNGNGTYTASFDLEGQTAPHADKHWSLALLLNGKHIGGSPFALSTTLVR